MKKQFAVYLLSLLFAAAICGACQPRAAATRAAGDERTERNQMNELAKLSNLKLPVDVKLLYQGDEDRDGEKIKRFVIRAASPINLPEGKEQLKIPAESVLGILQKLVPDEAPRDNVISDEATVCEWTNDYGAWRASLVATNKNHFLDLEHFAIESK